MVEGNLKHAWEHGLTASGDNFPTAKLKQRQVDEIRRRYKRYNSRRGNGKELAKEFNISQAQLSLIVNHKAWKVTAA